MHTGTVDGMRRCSKVPLASCLAQASAGRAVVERQLTVALMISCAARVVPRASCAAQASNDRAEGQIQCTVYSEQSLRPTGADDGMLRCSV